MAHARQLRTSNLKAVDLGRMVRGIFFIMGGDGHNQPVPVGHQHHDPIPAQVGAHHIVIAIYTVIFVFPPLNLFACRIRGTALPLAFASSNSNSVKMDLPKAATNPSLTRASFPLEVLLRLAR